MTRPRSGHNHARWIGVACLCSLASLASGIEAPLRNGQADPPAQLETKIDGEPTAAEYVDLSLAYSKQGEYAQCIDSATKALIVTPVGPNSAIAHNNICACLNGLGQFEKGIEACEEALALDPDYALAQGNLDWAKRKLESRAEDRY